MILNCCPTNKRTYSHTCKCWCYSDYFYVATEPETFASSTPTIPKCLTTLNLSHVWQYCSLSFQGVNIFLGFFSLNDFLSPNSDCSWIVLSNRLTLIKIPVAVSWKSITLDVWEFSSPTTICRRPTVSELWPFTLVVRITIYGEKIPKLTSLIYFIWAV